MDPTDPPSEEETQDGPAAPSRPWGPGSPAPGTPVSDFDVARDEEAKLEASTATALYEAARFPDLEDVAPKAAGGSARTGGSAAKGGEVDEGEKSGLRILGVPAPKEIAGPVLAALALAGLVYGWRRRRRRRS